jgi:hemoglobin/transferrin/lactoferrin receptor protein
MDDVNVGFTNFRGGYTSLANPNLRSERVQSIELGWRQSFDNLTLSISAYHNEYEDFIESLAVLGFNPATNLLEFQARKIDDVEIKGVDLSVSYQLQDWQVRLASSWQDSEDKSTGEELESVLPAQTVVGIQYGQMDQPWRVELVGTYTQDANVIAAADGQPEPFIAPSSTLFDLLAHYQVNDNFRINAGVFNITDIQYWYASEVRGRTVDENLDRFTAPGRNYSINVVYNF